MGIESIKKILLAVRKQHTHGLLLIRTLSLCYTLSGGQSKYKTRVKKYARAVQRALGLKIKIVDKRNEEEGFVAGETGAGGMASGIGLSKKN